LILTSLKHARESRNKHLHYDLDIEREARTEAVDCDSTPILTEQFQPYESACRRKAKQTAVEVLGALFQQCELVFINNWVGKDEAVQLSSINFPGLLEEILFAGEVAILR